MVEVLALATEELVAKARWVVVMSAAVGVSMTIFMGVLGEILEIIQALSVEMDFLVEIIQILVEMLEIIQILVVIATAGEAIQIWVLGMVFLEIIQIWVEEITQILVWEMIFLKMDNLMLEEIRIMAEEVEAGQVF
jgi:hypothetical protein